ncbi:uncharacterized protein LOC101848738 isoform X2 [Aplysia californica]|nr:uncharacterized protein LOC101848738 isoform X2 [Aplysia californica]
MEEEIDVAVSLDELTLDLAGDVPNTNKDVDIGMPDFHLDSSLTGDHFKIDDFTPNISSKPQNAHSETQMYTKDQGDQGVGHCYQVDSLDKAELSETTDIPVDPCHMDPLENTIVLDLDSATEPGEVDDFEAEIPPLALFPSTKNDDNSEDSDSEFEFEVPNRPPLASQQNPQQIPASTHVFKEANSITKDQKVSGEKADQYDIDLQPVQSEHLVPDILTPRDKTVSDFTYSDFTGNIESSGSKFSSANVGEISVSSLSQPTIHSYDCPSDIPSDGGKYARGITHSASETGYTAAEAIDRNGASSPDSTDNDETGASKPSIVTTAEDWEDVQTVEPGFAKPGDQLRGSSNVVDSKPLIEISDAWTQFESLDYSSVKDQIKTNIERKGFSAFSHLLFGPPKLHKDLLEQRDLFFCIAATPMDNENQSHIHVLQTVYRCLTGSKFDCQRFGGHWEEIGFQGRDPATDLRGTGMLALLHILFFLRDASTKQLSRDVYKLSLHPTQNFPFCIMSINLTRICLQVFREELFNKECNRRKNVISTMNDVHAALFLRLYQLWKKGKTISDSGFVLQEVETYCRKHSKNVFKDMGMYEKLRKQQGPFGEHMEGDPSFFSVCKEDECDDKSPAELY